ncbi:Bystin-domain containing protein [Nitzschia inconspicua]|uniref:Bystin-domain containing protein n=1 Tax=Nitzschia inconspicua TaxID=303405 RepID=A0A9K3PUA5_9STRA|nr:Bystin-domain containing protein [Nitzschia inconspicua]
MPKVKKLRAPALDSQQVRHEPLGQVIDGDANRGKYAVPSRRRRSSKEIKQNDEYLDEKTSRRILEMSQEQDLEEELEEQRRWTQQQRKGKRQQNVAAALDSDEEEDEEVEDIFIDEVEEDYIENDQGYVNVKDGTLGISAEDEAIVAAMNKNSEGAGEERRTLADLILGKIAEKEARDSGDLWTPQAMYAATRIFASNLNPKMAQRFYYLVLLDAVRADIYEHKKLNYHYYISLKKAVYKPAAFFKGILLPLCKEECTLREAAIVASVLQRVSIPVHHSAVAIHKLAQMTEYNGAASIFIKTLLNKKYALPVPVIGSLVQHFASFINDDRDLPVLWHQALLVFVQRYKNEVKDQARESLRLVMKKHFHHKITPEIRRELFGAAAWKEERSTAVSKNNDSNMVLA